MNRKVKWGVIGSGGIAKRRTIPEGIVPAGNATLNSVFDINDEVNNAIANEFNAQAFNNIDEFLNSNIDAVYIATPVNKHYEQVVKCAKKGKHVLCEKPLGLTISEAEKMILLCKQEKVILGTGLMMRFHSQHKAAKKMVQEGNIGKPAYARAQLSCWYPPIEGAWRQDPELGGGGSLMDMGSHCIDLLEMIFGEVKSVISYNDNFLHAYKSEDGSLTTLLFKNGAIGTVDTFFCIPDNSSKNVLELYGSKGSIIAEGTIGQGNKGNMTAYLENDDVDYNANQIRNNSSGLKINPEPENTYLSEIVDFSNAVIENGQPSNDAETGLRIQKIIAACYESAKSGKYVEIGS